MTGFAWCLSRGWALFERQLGLKLCLYIVKCVTNRDVIWWIYRFEDLMKEEKITSQEITALEKKFEMWAVQGASSARSTARSKPVSVVANMDVTKDLPPEVAAFEVPTKNICLR